MQTSRFDSSDTVDNITLSLTQVDWVMCRVLLKWFYDALCMYVMWCSGKMTGLPNQGLNCNLLDNIVRQIDSTPPQSLMKGQ